MGHAARQHSRALTEIERRTIQAVLHRHVGRVRNVDELEGERLTACQRIADAVANTMGAWRFIIFQSCLLAGWVTLNVVGWVQQWDPYPFILLNLALSFQMMSQDCQEAKDRLHAEQDYQVNLRAELQVVAIHAWLDELAGRQWEVLLSLQREQLELLGQRESLAREVHDSITTG
jgi:uncharacterized membrane protein